MNGQFCFIRCCNRCTITRLSISSDLKKDKRGFLQRYIKHQYVFGYREDFCPLLLFSYVLSMQVGAPCQMPFLRILYSAQITVSYPSIPTHPYTHVCQISARISITCSPTPKSLSASPSSTITIISGKMSHMGPPKLLFYGTYKYCTSLLMCLVSSLDDEHLGGRRLSSRKPHS